MNMATLSGHFLLGEIAIFRRGLSINTHRFT